jgi:ATP-dependent Lon protease
MEYPVIISRELIALPSTENTITAGRSRTINVIKRYLADPKNNKKFILLTQDNPDVEDPKIKDVYSVCTLCEILSVRTTNKKDVYTIKFKSVKRMTLLKLYEASELGIKANVFEQVVNKNSDEDFYVAEVETLKELDTTNESIPAKINELYDLFKKTTIKSKNVETKIQEFMSSKSVSSTIDEIINFVTIADYPKYKDIRKDVLHELNIVTRLDLVIEFFKSNNTQENMVDKLKSQIDSEINQKVNENLSKQQKEFYLREKMKAVKEEIGKINPGESDINSFKKRLEDNPYPNYIKEKVLAEINRMEANSFSQENAITKQYIE